MAGHEQWGMGADRPTVEQIEEYHELMTEILHNQGRGVRLGRVGERANTRVGTEYLLPGAHTDWSIPDNKFRTHIERERRYSASYRKDMGEAAGRLLVLESDSVRVGDEYKTRRNFYRFGWHELMGVYEAERLPMNIISDARTDMELIAQAGGPALKVMFDHEYTVERREPNETAGYMRYVNPLRETVSPWETVSDVDFDGLLQRTDEYGRDMRGDAGRDELAS